MINLDNHPELKDSEPCQYTHYHYSSCAVITFMCKQISLDVFYNISALTYLHPKEQNEDMTWKLLSFIGTLVVRPPCNNSLVRHCSAHLPVLRPYSRFFMAYCLPSQQQIRQTLPEKLDLTLLYDIMIPNKCYIFIGRLL